MHCIFYLYDHGIHPNYHNGHIWETGQYDFQDTATVISYKHSIWSNISVMSNMLCLFLFIFWYNIDVILHQDIIKTNHKWDFSWKYRWKTCQSYQVSGDPTGETGMIVYASASVLYYCITNDCMVNISN